MKTYFTYKSKKYKIVLKRVDCIGDYDAFKKEIYIDKNMPKRFHQGIALHELIERDLIKKGHSYKFSHNVAQKKELEFYDEKFGNGKQMLDEEEFFVNKIFNNYILFDLKRFGKKKMKLVVQPKFNKTIKYKGKIYKVNNSKKQINVSDVDLSRKVVYVDFHIPLDLIEGEALHVIIDTLEAGRGKSYMESHKLGIKKQKQLYNKKFGKKEGMKKFKFMQFIKLKLFEKYN